VKFIHSINSVGLCKAHCSTVSSDMFGFRFSAVCGYVVANKMTKESFCYLLALLSP